MRQFYRISSQLNTGVFQFHTGDVTGSRLLLHSLFDLFQ